MGAQPFPRSSMLYARQRRRTGIVASELFTHLALTYAQLRDELHQLELNPFGSSIERTDLLYRMSRVRARMASVPIYVR